MKPFLIISLSLAAALVAQDGNTQGKHDQKDEVTIRGCVSRSNGDYILMRQDLSYELQATGKLRLKNYLGNRVEVTGRKSPSLSTSSDAMNRLGSAAPVTLTITSIKTLDKSCSESDVSR